MLYIFLCVYICSQSKVLFLIKGKARISSPGSQSLFSFSLCLCHSYSLSQSLSIFLPLLCWSQTHACWVFEALLLFVYSHHWQGWESGKRVKESEDALVAQLVPLEETNMGKMKCSVSNSSLVTFTMCPFILIWYQISYFFIEQKSFFSPNYQIKVILLHNPL